MPRVRVRVSYPAKSEIHPHRFCVLLYQIHLSNVVCEGSEQSILECSNDGWGVVGKCTHKDDAGVRCIDPGMFMNHNKSPL